MKFSRMRLHLAYSYGIIIILSVIIMSVILQIARGNKKAAAVVG